MKKINWLVFPIFFVFMLGLSNSAFAVVFCTAGQKQYQISGCSQQTNTCCSFSQGGPGWSGWGGQCCTSTKPATFQSCTTNGTTGSQTRTVTCNFTTGSWSTGSWGSCLCSSGATTTSGCSTYASGKYKVKTCSASGYWSSCQCPESTGNGKINGKPYCEGTPREAPVNLKVDELDNSCWHGIWSDTKCTGICCCAGHTPSLDSYGNPQCKKNNRIQGACVCQTPAQIGESGGGSGGLIGGFDEMLP